jgi:peptidyl-prolyl cis-trans isomerase B (cyclophilin B)
MIGALLTVSCKKDSGKMVLIETELGNIKIRLFESTPIHTQNFLKLAEEGFYNGTLFHRVIPGFMIQGGDPDSKNATPDKMLGMGGPGYELLPEIGAPHFNGAVSAARLPDQVNMEKRSSGSQFFIVSAKPVSVQELDQITSFKGIKYTDEQRDFYLKQGGMPMLDKDYTVFGEVVEGMDVVVKIQAVQTGQADRPLKDIKMNVKIL